MLKGKRGDFAKIPWAKVEPEPAHSASTDHRQGRPQTGHMPDSQGAWLNGGHNGWGCGLNFWSMLNVVVWGDFLWKEAKY